MPRNMEIREISNLLVHEVVFRQKSPLSFAKANGTCFLNGNFCERIELYPFNRNL